MLASRSAWMILRADHALMRQRLDLIAELVVEERWHTPGPELRKLVKLVNSLLSFDTAFHRPKGTLMLNTVRGRSPEGARLISQMEEERDQDDQLLVQTIDMLHSLQKGVPPKRAACATILSQHRDRALEHMHREETLVAAFTEKLLTKEEWSRVASQISAVLYPSSAQSSEGDADEAL